MCCFDDWHREWVIALQYYFGVDGSHNYCFFCGNNGKQIYKNLPEIRVRRKVAVWFNKWCWDISIARGMHNYLYNYCSSYIKLVLVTGCCIARWLHGVCVGFDVEFCFDIFTTTHKKICVKSALNLWSIYMYIFFTLRHVLSFFAWTTSKQIGCVVVCWS